MEISKSSKSKTINIPASKITGDSILKSSAAARAARNPESPVQPAISTTNVANARKLASKLPADKQALALTVLAKTQTMKQPTNTTANY